MEQQGWGKRLLVKVGIIATAVATCWGGLATATTTTVDTSASGDGCPTRPNAEDGRPEIDVTNCGTHSANPMDTVDDTDAVEFASNQLNAVVGGGHVYFPPAPDGAYLVHGVDHRSNVDYYGSDARTTTLKRLGTANPREAVLRGQEWMTTGSIAKDQSTLTVTDASKIAVGSVVAVQGAGGPNPVQSSAATVPITAGSTSLSIQGGNNGKDDWAYLPNSRFLIVDNELISYASRFGTIFKGLVRGVQTTAAAHAVGARVSQALQLVAEVTRISGNSITLDRAAKFTVGAGAPVVVGSSNMSVRNLTIDGNQPTGGFVQSGSIPWPMNYAMVRRLVVTGCIIKNGDNGGIRLERGTRDALITGNTFMDNGEEITPGSAHVWLFIGVERTVVSQNQMSGAMKHGVAIDDRTEHATGWDAPSIFNRVTDNTIDLQEDPTVGPDPGARGVSVAGAWAAVDVPHTVVSGNRFIANQSPVAGGGIGVHVGQDVQGTSPVNSNMVEVSGNTFIGRQYGVVTNGMNNAFARNVFGASDLPACHEEAPASGNTWMNNSANCMP